jgi:hypothetical protein
MVRQTSRPGAASIDPVSMIRDVKALAAKAGGIKALQQLVDALAE